MVAGYERTPPQFRGRNLGHSDYLNWGTAQLGEPTQSGHIGAARA